MSLSFNTVIARGFWVYDCFLMVQNSNVEKINEKNQRDFTEAL